MAFLEDVFKGGNIATGLGVAIGAAVLGPVVLPVVGSSGRWRRPRSKWASWPTTPPPRAYPPRAPPPPGRRAGTGIGALFSEARAEVDAQLVRRGHRHDQPPGRNIQAKRTRARGERLTLGGRPHDGAQLPNRCPDRRRPSARGGVPAAALGAPGRQGHHQGRDGRLLQSAAETLARLRETLEDITAEAAFERAAEQRRTEAESATAAPARH